MYRILGVFCAVAYSQEDIQDIAHSALDECQGDKAKALELLRGMLNAGDFEKAVKSMEDTED